ncbi:MAG: isoaspartyl peptidase/L-asparaginase [Methanomassiliicoccales archaeon]|nr:MAG: isoaspartyl peptidase/L-asparaginase [Methanomassiliicoccales archaeon]
MKAIIVHGGAWNIPEELHEAHIKGCAKAVDIGYDLLRSGSGSLEAVYAAVEFMESDCTFDAGCGSFLNAAGEVEMDAIIMNGRTLELGSVAAIKNVRHPISVARMVMERTKHCMLVGEGATKFANSVGIELIPTEELVSPRELERWKMIRSTGSYEQKDSFTSFKEGPMGTVGAVAIDDEGDICVATSTGGTPNKMVGRVGDSPLVGCGTYADNHSAGVSATGFGEALMKICIARRICCNVEKGMDAPTAAYEAIRYLADRVDGHGGVVVIDKKGNIGYHFNTPRMAIAYVDKDGKRTSTVLK